MVSNSAQEEKRRNFTVVLRGPSAVIFWPNEKMKLDNVASKCGTVSVTYASRWIQKRSTATVPGHLWIEVVGTGDSLDDILEEYSRAAIGLLPLMSFCANASIIFPQIEIGYESTSGITKRDFFQACFPGETDEINMTRHFNIDDFFEIAKKFESHDEKERISRALGQYQIALENWRIGQEIFSVAHLWMAVEALTKVLVAKEIVKAGAADASELAAILNCEKNILDSVIRLNTIFKNDKNCYGKGKKCSDGFEHGFLPFGELTKYAREIRESMAGYVRQAIFDVLELEGTTVKSLSTAPYDQPLGPFAVNKYFRGSLLGSAEKLGMGENPYPYMRWESRVMSCEPGENGKINYVLDDNLTVEIGDGLRFQAEKFEAWKL